MCELTRLFLIYFFLFCQEAAPPGAEEDEVAAINKAGAPVLPPCSSGRRRLRGRLQVGNCIRRCQRQGNAGKLFLLTVVFVVKATILNIIKDHIPALLTFV